MRTACGLVRRSKNGPSNKPVTRQLTTKGVNFGTIKATRHGNNVQVDTSGGVGVNPDLRVRPFFFQGGTISMREFLVGDFNAEMGLQSVDLDLKAAADGARITTPSGTATASPTRCRLQSSTTWSSTSSITSSPASASRRA